jgi:hypothetical protein
LVTVRYSGEIAVSVLKAEKQRGCRRIPEALTETSVFSFLYWTNFSEGGGYTAGREAEKIPSGTWGLIQELVTDNVSS